MAINAPITCILVDALIAYRFERSDYKVLELLSFNLSVTLFVGGIAGFSLVISKLFSQAGFATQIGSILYLVPIFMSLYLSVLDMKHNFANTANTMFDEMEGGLGIVDKEKKKKVFERPSKKYPWHYIGFVESYRESEVEREINDYNKKLDNPPNKNDTLENKLMEEDKISIFEEIGR